MSRKHCIRAAIGRRLTRAASSIGRVFAAIQYCSETWRPMTADLASAVFVFLVPPMTFATIPLLIESKGERRAPRFDV